MLVHWDLYTMILEYQQKHHLSNLPNCNITNLRVCREGFSGKEAEKLGVWLHCWQYWPRVAIPC